MHWFHADTKVCDVFQVFDVSYRFGGARTMMYIEPYGKLLSICDLGKTLRDICTDGEERISILISKIGENICAVGNRSDFRLSYDKRRNDILTGYLLR